MQANTALLRGLMVLTLGSASWFAAALPAGANIVPLVAAVGDAPAAATDESAAPADPARDQMQASAGTASDLARIEAHLTIAGELVADGKTEEAVVHLVRARDDFYPQIAEGLTEAGVPSLAEPLAATANGDAKSIAAAIVAVAAARQGIGKDVPDKVYFAIKTAAALLYGGAEEYAAWLNAPGSATVIDFQGARGAVMLAAALIEPVMADIGGRNREAAVAIQAALDQIRRGFPGNTPPSKPILLEGDLNAAIYAINGWGEEL